MWQFAGSVPCSSPVLLVAARPWPRPRTLSSEEDRDHQLGRLRPMACWAVADQVRAYALVIVSAPETPLLTALSGTERARPVHSGPPAPPRPSDRRPTEPGSSAVKGGRRPSRVTRSALDRDPAWFNDGSPEGQQREYCCHLAPDHCHVSGECVRVRSRSSGSSGCPSHPCARARWCPLSL